MTTSLHLQSASSSGQPPAARSDTARSGRMTGARRWVLATAVVALAAGWTQAALAAPPDGMAGMRGGHGPEMMQDRPHGMHDGAGGGGMGMAMSPRFLERMFDTVNATPDQRTQITRIMEAARTDMKAQGEARRALHQQSQAIFTQPTVDARAAEAVRQQMMAQHDQASKRMLQARLDISRVLTPEQRKLLADRKEKHRAMMERHRSERESLMKPRT
jgi:periplasmic protein CpxP/Spy